jgi:4-amino-4-deoxy-L-arabinose transferase-like glycosyltransferase
VSVSRSPHHPITPPRQRASGALFAEHSLNRRAWLWRQGPGTRPTPLVWRLLGWTGCLLALWLLLFHGLAERDLWSSHEARAGMNAQTILADGDWLLPHLFDGQPELQKPPLYYWLVAGIGWLRGGVDALAVRLPAALSGLACVLLVYGWLAAQERRRAGFLAAAILATTLHFPWLARIGRIDMPLTLTTAVALFAFAAAARRDRETERRREGEKKSQPDFSGSLLSFSPSLCLLFGYLALAAGILLKGPVGLLLPLAALLAHAVVEGRLAAPWRFAFWRGRGSLLRASPPSLIWGVPLVLVLTVPWFVAAHLRTGGEFTRVFFGQHNLERGLGGWSDGPPRWTGHPWWAYVPMFAGDFLPWTPILGAAILWCWWTRQRLDADARFGAVWFAALFLVLSCARFKRADYLLPAFPGAALFLGCVLDRWLARCAGNPKSETRNPKPIRISSFGFRISLLGLIVLGAVVGWVVRVDWVLPEQASFRDYTAFADQVRTARAAGQAGPEPSVTFFRTEAHALAFHVGRPLEVLVQWEQLRSQLETPGTHLVVLPPESAANAPRLLPGVSITELVRNTDLAGGRHERPLVLVQMSRGQGSGMRGQEKQTSSFLPCPLDP